MGIRSHFARTCSLVCIAGALAIGVDLLQSRGLISSSGHSSVSPRAEALGIVTVSASEVRALSEPVVMVDARSPQEFLKRHLSNAVNVPYMELGRRPTIEFAKLRPESTTIVYCKADGCDLADRLAVLLRENGWRDVRVLRGGLAEWERLGGATEVASE